MMRFTYRLTFICLVLIFGNSPLEAQPNSFYFMHGLPQTIEMNPAKSGLRNGFYISLPLLSGFDVSVNTNSWRLSDLVHSGSGMQKDSMIWDFGHLVNSFSENNFVLGTTSLTLIDFGWKDKMNSYSFSWSEHAIIEPFFSKELAEMVYYGNEKFIGNTFNSGKFGLTGMHYRQFAFNYSKELNGKLSVGVTGKLLFGMAAITTRNLNLAVDMPSTRDNFDVSARGNVMVSAPFEVIQSPTNDLEFFAKSDFTLGKYLTNFSNPGIAVDLGFTDKISSKLELSMSLTDFGIIKWTRHTNIFTGQGKFLYEGINLNDKTKNPPTAKALLQAVQDVKDSIKKAFPIDMNSTAFPTLMPVKLYMGAEYRFTNYLSLGALARVSLFNSMVHTYGTASLNLSVRRNLSLTAAYSLNESALYNFGIGTTIRVGFFQVYAATDNILSIFYPVSANYLNLRIGVNVIFEEIGSIARRYYQYKPPKRVRQHRS